ncbi:hypothetical protein [Dankookia sp. P2]|uniref:hypothetical protein n=1 Tax=Dankookia sp. P2 TaxID=3423955 RepID=UPI003D67C0A6
MSPIDMRGIPGCSVSIAQLPWRNRGRNNTECYQGAFSAKGLNHMAVIAAAQHRPAAGDVLPLLGLEARRRAPQ